MGKEENFYKSLLCGNIKVDDWIEQTLWLCSGYGVFKYSCHTLKKNLQPLNGV